MTNSNNWLTETNPNHAIEDARCKRIDAIAAERAAVKAAAHKARRAAQRDERATETARAEAEAAQVAWVSK